MLLASNIFTPYYILAVSFGAFAVIVSLIGMKKPDFPGKFYGPLILIGVLFAVATFTFVWKGGEEEVEHREHGGDTKAEEGASVSPNPLPAGLRAGA